MGTRNGAISTVLILAGMMAVVPGSALAIVGATGNTAGGATCLDTIINPSAPGAKIVGTMNVSYQWAGTGQCIESTVTTNKYSLVYTMRVEKGSTLYAFDGMSPYSICVSDCSETVRILNDFVSTVVAPFVYPTLFPPITKKAPAGVVLKGATKEVGSVLGNAFTPGLNFPWFIVDVEYAVQ